MANTNFIAAVDLGSSYITGIVGAKNDSGGLTILACEREHSANSIRRGVIYNVEDAAFQISSLIKKLENKIPGASIIKVYVGVGGQSLRSIDHVVAKSLGAEGVVGADVVDGLYKECKNYKPEGLDVLSIVSPIYSVDGKQEVNPVGVSCSRIEAHYKLIVCRPSVRRNIINSINERVKKDVVGIIVSPLALSDVVLSDDEKELGCALIDFGGGVTSLTIFKNKRLVGMCVVPLGASLITKDMVTLNMVEAEAERVKIAYGDVVLDKENDELVEINTANGSQRKAKVSEINVVVEARVQEIVENVIVRLEEYIQPGDLGAGVIIAGGGASLKNLDEHIRKRLKTEVRHATVRKGLIERSNVSVEPELAVAIGLLSKGSINCAYTPPTPPTPPVMTVRKEEPPVVPEKEMEEVVTVEDDPTPVTTKSGDNKKKNKKSSFLEKVSGMLFDGEEMGGSRNKKNNSEDED
ncbi:cell division protein FtsA [Parabacteroides sp. PF5-5]|uniref:cell division protein FtsA n=1 Tax=unclassified Parabacteroides TaxID=2649774 RepID=UPI00247320E0|nr:MULTISPECIES: cell division protein FtsA [unclassified Parabacteroides]MDH6303370.1 cell division protein FtsA [Parabacteroides sp. PH5-39]MDH6314693.1 cell division protein FtsA [Parabacteroides sp. PF5-13]MDH6318030.1 cell division protein FtsA [Parabacteroides sp. PH5-13]MDH6322039.1 cell division protein FtsA [Parabacteroides sp. PH5-8]MDH6326162.1 cell division protein FtsA [Parabacteroides sp. PH5-41]